MNYYVLSEGEYEDRHDYYFTHPKKMSRKTFIALLKKTYEKNIDEMLKLEHYDELGTLAKLAGFKRLETTEAVWFPDTYNRKLLETLAQKLTDATKLT